MPERGLREETGSGWDWDTRAGCSVCDASRVGQRWAQRDEDWARLLNVSALGLQIPVTGLTPCHSRRDIWWLWAKEPTLFFQMSSSPFSLD